MRPIIEILITEDSGDRHVRLRVCGLLLFHRHEMIEGTQHHTAGFLSFPFAPMDVTDEDLN